MRIVRVAVIVWLAGLASGCATYIDRIDKATLMASAGNYQGAVGEMNTLMGVGSSTQLPAQWKGDTPLAVLDRGSLQQALATFKDSARDLSAAEQEIELLDLSTDPIATLGGYLYSDSVKKYQTPPTERLSLNAVNLLNYLGDGDLDGAAVEARRFQVMREYLSTLNIQTEGPSTLGCYLAGFVFEKQGEGDRALRYYEEALANGPLSSLDNAITRLARANPYRGPRLKTVLAKNGKVDSKPPTELLVVLSLGRVPHKIPERIPVGAAVGIAGSWVSGNINWLKYGATKVVIFPAMVSTPSTLGPPDLRLDGGEVAVDELTNLGASIQKEYDEAKPKIVAAALTRMAARAAVAEGVRAAGNQQSGALGDVLAIVVEGAMDAADRPDTRSWSMLADKVLVARVPVTPGKHTVDVSFGGDIGRQIEVDVAEGGFSTVVVTEPR